MIATLQTNLLTTSLGFYGSPATAASLVVIDAAVEQALELAEAVEQPAVAIILDPNQDGLWQINAALDCCPQVAAIHILAHATPGCLNLGHVQLTIERLGQYQPLWTSLAKRQIALYLYGCRVAAEPQGAKLMQRLHQLTGAAIAASTTLTGSAAQGGDWGLSYRIGQVEATMPIAPAVLAAYPGLLTAPVITDQAEITKVERATNEGTATAITGIAIEDTSLGNLTVTLNVDRGQLNLASTSGLTVTNNGSGSVTLVGLRADINAALNGMVYRPTATMTTVNGRTDEFAGLESLRISVTNSVSATALKTVALNVTPVNDAPTISPVAATVLEGGNIAFTTNNFGIVDVDNLDIQVIVKINSLPSKGYLSLNGARLVPGSTFSLEDIPNLVYHHDGTQTTAAGGLSDAFSITVDDGAGGAIGITSIPISIAPVNQLPQIAAVTKIVEGQSAPVTIAIQDPDQLAANHTIEILTLPPDGVLRFNGTAVTVGQTLTSAQLSQLTFTHDGNDQNFGYPPDATFQVRVTDDGGGTATPGSVTSTVTLTFKPNNDDPLLVNNTGLSYNTSDAPPVGVDAFTRLITASELRVTDPDSPTRYLVYTVKQTVDASLGQLQLLVGGQWKALGTGSSFTQDDVDNQRLRYVFHRAAVGTFTDRFKFEVRDSEVTEFLPGRPGQTRNGGIWLPDGSGLAEMTFNIQVTTQGGAGGAGTAPTLPANTTPIAVIVDQAATDEGGLVGITRAMLEYSDVDTPVDQIVYRIVQLPTSGKILLDGRALGRFDSFTQQEINAGRIQFQHNGSEDLSDSFRFTVSDGTNVTDEREFKLEMTPINDRPTVTVKGKPYLVEGGTIRLSDVDFSVYDDDGTGEKVGQGYATPNTLTFKVTTLPQNGLLQVERAGSWVTIDQNTVLTKAELDGKNLRYTHDGSETSVDSFRVQANDNTTGTTNNLSDIITVEIEIAKLNDLPGFSTAKLLTVDEAGAGAIKGSNGIAGNEPHLVYVDPDNSTLQRQYRITASVVNGQLLLNGKALSVGSTFTQKDLDENRISYRHSGSETTSDRFEFQVSDGSGSSVPGAYDIVINPTNDAPELTVPGSQLLINSDTLTFTAANGQRIVVTDPDLVSLQTGEVDILKVTLDLQQGGTTFNDAVLTLGSTTGLTVISQTNGKILFEGTRANVQAALDGLQLRTQTDLDGTLSLVVTVDDRLNGDYRTDLNVIAPTGAIVTRTINISASQVNDPAQITAPATATVNEDGSLLFNGGAGQASPISIQDVDDFGQPMTVQLSVDAGRLNATGAAGNGTSQITLTGSKDQINAALAALSFTPIANTNGPVQLTVNVLNDGGGTNVASRTVAITVNPLNDTPVLTAPAAPQTLNTNNPLTFTNGAIAINDSLDLTQGAADSFVVSVAARKQSDGSSYGRLSATASGSASVSGVNTDLLTITGTQAEINAVLNSLSYVPDDFNVDQIVNLVVTVNDSNNGAEGTGSTGQPATATRTIVVNVSGTNDAPVLTPPTAAITVNEDSSVTLTGASRLFVVNDPDDFGANDLVATVTVDRGSLSLVGNDGATVTGTSSSLTITGTEAQINAALDGLIYTPNPDYHGQAKLDVTINDNGNTGTGGAQSDTKSIFITVNPINDRPVATSTATLAAVAEDTSDPVGAVISSLITSSNYSDSTDNQTTNGGGTTETGLSHIAIVGSTSYLTTQGVWQFKNDLGNWVDIPTSGLSATNALVVRADRQIRFKPAPNFHGIPGSLSLRLADSSGVISESTNASDRKNASTSATGVWSSGAVTLNTSVTAVNDAPTIDSPGTAATLGSINEDVTTGTGNTVSTLFSSKYRDTIDTQSGITGGGNSATSFGGIAIVGNAALAAQGVWQYSTNSGTTWTTIPTDDPITGLSNTAALTLPTTARLRFVPATDYNGAPGQLTVRFSDSAVVYNAAANISSAVGGTGNWSASTTTLATTINPINDAPVLSGTGVTGGYTEQLAGLNVGANLTGISDIEISRGERSDLLTATVQITDFVAGDRLSFTLGSTGITVSENGTGTYILSSASRANLLQVLQSATYSSTSDNPTNFDAAADRNRTIEFRINDNNGTNNLSTIVTSTVNITAVNDAPDAINDTNTIAEEAVSVTGNVRSNDTDPDNQNSTLTVSAVNGTAGDVGRTITGKYGSLLLNSNGTYSYTLDNSNPAVQALGVGKTLTDEVFNYTISDGTLTDSAQLTITITGTNDAPVAVADTNRGVEDGPPITGFVLPNDTDRDTGDLLAVNRVNGSLANVGQAVTGTYGVLTLNANGSYSYAINPGNATVQALGVGESISESFTYQITDGQGGSSSSTLTITIDGSNDAPIAQADSRTSIVRQPAVTGDVLVNDSDIDGDPLTVTDLSFGGNSVPLGTPFNSSYGRLTLKADGSYSYQADASNPAVIALADGQTLTETFIYQISDGQGGSSTASLTLTIRGINDAPVAQLDTNAISEDAVNPVTGNALTNDNDIDQDSLTVAAVNGASANLAQSVPGLYGSLVLNANGSYSYTVNNANSAVQALGVGESLTDSFSYQISDGKGGSSTANVVITINGSNDGPVAIADVNSVNEDGAAVSGNVLPNDTDRDTNDGLTVAAVNGSSANLGQAILGSYGSLTLNADGSYSYSLDSSKPSVQTLGLGKTLTDSFTYTVSDGQGGTASTTLTITINGTNDGPVANPDTATIAEDATAPATGDVLPNDSDIDGDNLTVVAVNGAAGDVGRAILGSYGSLTLNADGSYSYAVNNGNATVQALGLGESISESFTYRISDDQGGSSTSTLTITINGTNDAPVARLDSQSLTEDGGNTATGNALTNDGDIDGDPLTVTQVNGQAANLGQTVSGSYGSLVLNSDGSYSYSLNSAHAAVQALAVGETLTDSFGYQVSDGQGGFSTAQIQITINGSNDGPIAVADSNTIAEDATSPAAGNVLTDAAGRDRDPDTSDSLTVVQVNGSSINVGSSVTGSYGSLVLNANGSYSYQVNNGSGAVQALGVGETLTEAFSYQIADGRGGFDTTSLTITITGTNDSPVARADSATITEAEFSVDPVRAGNVLPNDSDIDGDPLTVSAVGGSSAAVGQTVMGQYGSLVLNADGSYRYQVDVNHAAVQGLGENESLTETFTYSIADGQGGSDSATLTITIGGTNSGPTAVNDQSAIAEDQALVNGNVITNPAGRDTDPDINDSLTVVQVNNSSASVGQPLPGSYGSLTLNSDGSYSYSLNNSSPTVQALSVGETLSETFTYQISDGRATSIATLTITINGTNDAPVAVADRNTLFEDASSPASGNVISDLAGQDSDLDGDSLTVVQVNGDAAQVGQAVAGQYGSLTLNADGSYSYSLDSSLGQIQALSVGETLSESFTYQISDGQGGTSTTTLTITIQGTNDAPVAQADANTVTEDGAAATGNLLPNDSDPDGDSLTVVQVNGDATQVGQAVVGQYGRLTVNADGSYSYSIDPTNIKVQALGDGEILSESFTYQISDGQGGTATATLTLTINGVNDGVVAVADSNTITEDAVDPVEGTVLTNDSDLDGDPLRVSQVNGDSAQVGQPLVGLYGTLVLNQDGTYSYQIDNSNAAVQALALGETLTDRFTYQISDGSSTSTTSLTLTITGSNDAPEAVADFNQIAEDATNPATGNVLFNDLDRDTADQLRVTQVGVFDSPLDPASVGIALDGQYGRLTLNADGTYSYQVDRNNPAVQNLPPGQTLTEQFEYEMGDGTSTSRATLTITIGENDAPVSQDQTVTTPEDQPYVFGTADFAFSDPDQGDQISLVRIDSLPAQGQLLLNGVAVTAGQEIAIAEIADGRLSFVPVENASGDSYAQLQFSVKDSSGTKNAFSTSPNSLTLNVTPVNDPPQLDLDGNDSSAPGRDYRTRFVPGQPVAVADLDTQISDLDNSQIQSALITLTNRPNSSSEFLALSGNLPAGITAAAYDPTTGELRLTGSASLADYQTAIASLVYGNSALVRNTSDRLVTVVVNDGEADSNLAQTLIAYDTDGDGVIDRLDLDMDNDGIPNLIEMGGNPNRDTDGDGILDLLDLDSDDDGLTDLRETGLSDDQWQALDRDGDGVIDSSNPFGSNGLADAVETNSDSGSLKQSPVDTDGDSTPDFQDRDSDNDGGSDLLESGLGFSDSDGNGQVDGPDQDGDGIRDGADRRLGFGGGSSQIWADRNSSGIPDHREISRRRSGSSGSDRVTGTDGDDILSGFSDLDVIYGRGGNDTIVGGSDKDRLFGDEGNDTVSGGSNDDWIEGGTDNDILNGGTGNDRMFGGEGDDILNAGQGNDWASGDGGNDRITGNEGNDQLLGGAGNDLLLGDRGNDLLQGGLGKDRLTGGQGRDRFVYSSVREFGDVVVDFEIVKDQFDLSALFPGKAGSMQNVRVKQQGQDALVQVNAGQGFRNLATVEDVQANTLDQRHFKF